MCSSKRTVLSPSRAIKTLPNRISGCVLATQLGSDSFTQHSNFTVQNYFSTRSAKPKKMPYTIQILRAFNLGNLDAIDRSFLCSMRETIEQLRFLLVYTPSIYRLNFLLTIGSKSQNT
jgi:hypothetical protein